MHLLYSAAGLLAGCLLLTGCFKHRDPKPDVQVARTGVIKDAWTDQPIPGLKVYLSARTWDLVDEDYWPDKYVLDSTITDTQGRFTVQKYLPRDEYSIFNAYGCQIRTSSWQAAEGKSLRTQALGQPAGGIVLKLERRYDLVLRTQVLNPSVDSFALTVRLPAESQPQRVSCGRRYAQWPCSYQFRLNLFPPTDTTQVTHLTYRSYSRRQLLRTDSVRVTGTRYLLSIQ